jgi:hypothetical protein
VLEGHGESAVIVGEIRLPPVIVEKYLITGTLQAGRKRRSLSQSGPQGLLIISPLRSFYALRTIAVWFIEARVQETAEGRSGQCDQSISPPHHDASA